MDTDLSAQYGIAYVIPTPGTTAQEVIDCCREVGAVVLSEKFCVRLRDDVGPELWTEESLRRSLGTG